MDRQESPDNLPDTSPGIEDAARPEAGHAISRDRPEFEDVLIPLEPEWIEALLQDAAEKSRDLFRDPRASLPATEQTVCWAPAPVSIGRLSSIVGESGG